MPGIDLGDAWADNVWESGVWADGVWAGQEDVGGGGGGGGSSSGDVAALRAPTNYVQIGASYVKTVVHAVVRRYSDP